MTKIFFKKIHNIFGLSSFLFLLILLVTGILLNHPNWIRNDSADVLVLDPKIEGKLYKGNSKGFYVSLDHGKTWTEADMLFSPQEVVSIGFDAQNFQRIYVAEKWGRIFLSEDGGKIWNILYPPFDLSQMGVELKCVSSAQNKLIVLTSHGFLLSEDLGVHWDLSGFHPEKKSLNRIVKSLHNGYFFGPKFVWFYDFSAMALFILLITGIYLWWMGRQP